VCESDKRPRKVGTLSMPRGGGGCHSGMRGDVVTFGSWYKWVGLVLPRSSSPCGDVLMVQAECDITIKADRSPFSRSCLAILGA